MFIFWKVRRQELRQLQALVKRLERENLVLRRLHVAHAIETGVLEPGSGGRRAA
jgi:hypothetical protein